jgi:fluoride exporter
VKILAVAVGGALGALLRYGASSVAQAAARSAFPWGTLGVNAVGCLLIGALASLFERLVAPPALRSLLFMGFLGAFTTFSTYALETLRLVQEQEYALAAANVALHNVLGLLLAAGGFLGIRAALGGV